MAKKTEEKTFWSYEEGRAWLKNTKIEKAIEKIITIVFGRRWKTSFQDILDSKQKSTETKTPEKKPL
jgi:hypothetical protein